jgi:hypothetical protein
MEIGNYIADNPRMAQPPQFWLQRLYDYDNLLRVLPSRQTPFAYVLARVARRTGRLTPQGIYDNASDTGMCAQYGLVPVCLIFRNGEGWTIDNIIAELQQRDIWAHGGAERAADMLDKAEADKAARIKADIRDDMWMRSGDAWRSYQARTGQRTKLNRPEARKRAAHSKQPTQTSGSTSGLGLVLTDA